MLRYSLRNHRQQQDGNSQEQNKTSARPQMSRLGTDTEIGETMGSEGFLTMPIFRILSTTSN
jgi:hypothetical protein